MIGFTAGKIPRYVVSFKVRTSQGSVPWHCSLIGFSRFQDPNPAMELIGCRVKILSSTVWVREVTSQTVPVNTTNTARSDRPWRR